MCGIAGAAGNTVIAPGETARRMLSAIAHRGPDGQGVWEDAVAPVSFAHARLAIIDLSATGRQPMTSSSGRYTITFNGEIYNYVELREELARDGCGFRGSSDAGVLVQAIDRWGVRETLPRLNGMFAFAVWDSKVRELSLARDRFGEKPLYYRHAGGTFMFASELKAFRGCPGVGMLLDADSVALFLRYNYVPGPGSIFQGIRKLPSASVLTIREPFVASPEVSRYWIPPARRVATNGRHAPEDFAERRSRIRGLLADAVKIRMRSDVPFGAFLSGGVDSSLVCAFMQAQAGGQIETFTIGSTDPAMDESTFAREVSKHLGTRHHEIVITSDDALRIIPDLPGVYDEPFADSSQIPTLLISRWAKKHVKVCLTGDGGDELFGGYRRYSSGRAVWSRAQGIPAPLRGPLARLLRALPAEAASGVLRPFAAGLSSFGTRGTFADKIGKIAEVLAMGSHFDLYLRLTTYCQDASLLANPRPLYGLAHPFLEGATAGRELVTDMMDWDQQSYLPDDILVKVDRASMSTGLETRAPFLDHRLAEAAAGLPIEDFLAGGIGKPLLRSILADHLPARLIERPKRGFGVPISSWLRGPLKEWAAELLSQNSLMKAGAFAPEPTARIWREHLAGARDRGDTLWAILCFTAWHRALGARS